MRNYAQFNATCTQSHGRLQPLWRLLSNRRTRSDLRRLQAMDDHALKDIGLTRDDLRVLMGLPNSADLHREAERLRLFRARE